MLQNISHNKKKEGKDCKVMREKKNILLYETQECAIAFTSDVLCVYVKVRKRFIVF